MFVLTVSLWSACVCAYGEQQAGPKHVILIIADDLGWDDVGFHGSEIPTPNLDALAQTGVILANYYVSPICTPSRSEIMTGRYAIHTGMQHGAINQPEPYGLGLDEKLLPQVLQSAGFATHLVGKWHLGFFKSEYTPTFRGFDSHFGYWSGKEDYWDHFQVFQSMWGLDFRDNMDVVDNMTLMYSTDVFTSKAVDIIKQHSSRNKGKPLFLEVAHQAVHSGNFLAPLEAPQKYIDAVAHITPYARRMLAAMTVGLDHSVGSIVAALHDADMLKDSLIIFTTDNGGPAAGFDLNMACNWPLRGVKQTLWEGGVRGTALVWSPQVSHPGRISENLMHATDWMPTILAATNVIATNDRPIDGVDQWANLKNSGNSSKASKKRTTVLHNIDDKGGFFAYRKGDFKIHFSEVGSWNGWYRPGQLDRLEPGLNRLDRLELGLTDSLQEKFGTNETQFLNYLKRTFVAGIPSHKQNRTSSMPSSLKHLKTTHSKVKAAIRDTLSYFRFRPLILNVMCGPSPDNASTHYGLKHPSRPTCAPLPCLFNVKDDPCEFHDVAASHPSIVRQLLRDVDRLRKSAVTPRNQRADPKADPERHGRVWVPWRDQESHDSL